MDICPYLRLKSDPASVAMFPTRAHGCFARGSRRGLKQFPYSRVPLSHQEEYCLHNPEWERCPYFPPDQQNHVDE